MFNLLQETLEKNEILDIITEFYEEYNDEKTELLEKWKSFINFLYHSKFIKYNEKKFYLSYEYEDIIETLNNAKNFIEDNEEKKTNDNLLSNINNNITKKYNNNIIIKRYNKSFEDLEDFLKNEKEYEKNIDSEIENRKIINNFLEEFMKIENPELLSKEEIVKEFSKLKNIKNFHIYKTLEELKESKNNYYIFYPYQDYNYGLLILLKFIPEWTKNNFSYNTLKNLYYNKDLKKFIKENNIYLEYLEEKEYKIKKLENELKRKEDFLFPYLKEKIKYIYFPILKEEN